MSKKVADELMTGLREAIGYVEGRPAKGIRVWEFPPVETKSARERLEPSQSEFAGVKNWARKRISPRRTRGRTSSRST